MRRDSEMRTAAPLLILAGVAVVAAVSRTATSGPVSGAMVVLCIVFAAFIAFGEIMRLTLPGGREAAPLASAGALAFALLPSFPTVAGLVGGIPWYLAITVVTLGSIVGAFPRWFVGRGSHPDELARRVLTTLVASAAFALQVSWFDIALVDIDSRTAIAMTVAAIAGGSVDALLAASVRVGTARVPWRTAVVDEFRALVGIASAIAATGVLIALAAPSMGYWALPVFAVPLLLTQFSFRRFSTIEATYLQTIRSLSKVTEVGGYTETGHSQRVSRLAVTVGREMGLSQRHLDDLEYAALMHDIGQLSLSDPIPGGATTMVSPLDQRQIAELGAAIIRQTGALDTVAEIVERQSDPYRPARGYLDSDLPLESRIIKAVNAYDDLVGASVESDRKQQALERLAMATDREFDPEVVDTLGRIVERQIQYSY